MTTAERQRVTYRSRRHPSRRRQEMRTFTVYAMGRWLRNASIDHSVYRLLNGVCRVYAWPVSPLDKLALLRFGFSTSVEYGLMYRNATDAPAWVPLAPQVQG